MPLSLAIMAGAAVVGAGASVASGIAGAQSASKANQRAEQNAEDQRRAQARAARLQNEYNQQVHEADQENYRRQRAYQWETAIKNWQYQSEIQDFQYLQAAKQFAGSVEATQEQLVYNSVAQQQAVESEQAAYNELLAQDAFQREGMMIESLQNEGRASLMQAGRSRAKAMQSTVAELGRNSAILRSSLMSAGQQSERNMREIALSRYADDIRAKNAMMIEPERLPEIPKPVALPERVFVEPMKVVPGFTPQPIRQSVAAPIFQAIGGAAQGVGAAAGMYAAYGGGTNTGNAGGTQQQSAAVRAGWPGNQNY
jgi:hypothetical protein